MISTAKKEKEEGLEEQKERDDCRLSNYKWKTRRRRKMETAGTHANVVRGAPFKKLLIIGPFGTVMPPSWPF